MKGCAITALVLIIVGFILGMTAGAVQGPRVIGSIVETVTGGRIQMRPLDIYSWRNIVWNEVWDDVWEEIVFNTGWSDWDNEYSAQLDEDFFYDTEYKVYEGDIEKLTLGSGISSLNIQAGGCEVYLLESEDENFYVEAWDTGKFQTFVSDNTLYLMTSKTYRLPHNGTKSQVTLYVPEDLYLQQIQIEIGAGLFAADALAADRILLSVGGGSMNLEDVDASEIFITMGAGDVVIGEMEIQSLHADVGLGNLTATGDIRSQADIECAMGNVELYLYGRKKDFNYSLECSMGNIMLDGSDYSGLARERFINNHAAKNIGIRCSVGNVQVIHLPEG